MAPIALRLRRTATRPEIIMPQTFALIPFLNSSGNRTPGSRSYSDLLDTLADSVCIPLLVLKRRSKR